MNIYTVLHHLVDKNPAADEASHRNLHDALTAHELGYDSLESLREDQRKAAARIDPAVAARMRDEATQLLATVKENQERIAKLLSDSAEATAAKATDDAAAAAAAAEAAKPATDAPTFPQPAAPPA